MSLRAPARSLNLKAKKDNGMKITEGRERHQLNELSIYHKAPVHLGLRNGLTTFLIGEDVLQHLNNNKFN